MKILHIDSSILGPMSFSREMTSAVMDKLLEQHPGAEVAYLDLGANPPPHLSPEVFAAAQQPNEDVVPEIQVALKEGQALLEQYLNSDIVVIGAGLYNLSVPSGLKAWIDRILIVGHTFRYTPEGQLEGLMGKQRAVLCISRGGFYNEGSPGAAVEHCESYLRALLGFIAVGRVDVITADGVAVNADFRAQAQAAVQEQIAAMAI